MQNHLFRYWGKADEKYVGATSWHPLAYHCLDVSSVAVSWWDASPTVQRTFLASFNYPEPQHLRAWGAFFVALHDLGKFDVRFQLKAPDALAAAWRPLGTRDHGLSKKDIAEFDHGWAGMAWANQEYRQWVRRDDPDREIWEQWQPWLAAVTVFPTRVGMNRAGSLVPIHRDNIVGSSLVILHWRKSGWGFIFVSNQGYRLIDSRDLPFVSLCLLFLHSLNLCRIPQQVMPCGSVCRCTGELPLRHKGREFAQGFDSNGAAGFGASLKVGRMCHSVGTVFRHDRLMSVQ
jgi:CRISPR-associated endonuclease Cas3-HD